MDNNVHLEAEHLRLRDVTSAMRMLMATIESSNQCFRAITDVRGTALAILSPAGRFLAANYSSARIFGYSTAEMVGKSFVAMAQDSDQPNVTEALSGGTQDAPRSFSIVVRAQGGRETTVMLYLHPILDRKGRCMAFLIAFEEPVLLQQGLLESLVQSEADLRRLYAHLMMGQERERKRIAAELHDSLGQALTLIKLIVEDSLSRIREGGVNHATALLQTAVLRIRETIGEVRQICNELRPRLLDDLGLVPTLASLCKQVEDGSGSVTVAFDCRVDEGNVPENLKADMFRIAQEAINNALKHAQATEIRVTLKRSNGEIVLAVQDDGIGFDNLPLSAGNSLHSGLGLLGMQERVEAGGGTFSIKSGNGGGTLVRAAWPT